jgi:hypothetical protein
MRNYQKFDDNPRSEVSVLVGNQENRNSCLKCIFRFVNFLMIFISIGLITAGVLGIMYLRKFFTVEENLNIYIPAILIFSGTLLGITSFIINFCDPQKHMFGYYTYSLVQIISFWGLVLAVILFFNKKEFIEHSFKTGFLKSVQNYSDFEIEIDFVQTNFECCGSNNYTDYFNTSWAEGLYKVPKSCCNTNEKFCINIFVNPLKPGDDIYKEGCSAKFDKMISEDFLAITAMVLVFSMIPLFLFLLSCCLMRPSERPMITLYRTNNLQES